MPRVMLKQLESYKFKNELDVRVSDVNYGGHLGNVQVVGLLHEARVLFLRELGFTEINLGDESTGIIQIDLAVNYKAEAFMGDRLIVESTITEIDSNSFRVCSRITGEGKLVALAECGFAAYSYHDRKIVPVPQSFIEKVR